jgi:hypothetical protein
LTTTITIESLFLAFNRFPGITRPEGAISLSGSDLLLNGDMDGDTDSDIEVGGQQMLPGKEMQICQDCRKIDFSLAMTPKPPLQELDLLEEWP